MGYLREAGGIEPPGARSNAAGIRATREAIDAADAAAAVAAAVQAKTEPTTLTVNVLSVPEGHYQQSDGSFQPNAILQIEHMPEPEPELPRSSHREALEARLAALPDKMLYALAGVTDDADAG